MPRPGRPSRSDVYLRLDEAAVEVRTRLGGLPDPGDVEGIWGAIWNQETHHSTAIEGNTLVLREVEVLLELGKAVGDRELREYMEVRGYADAARWVYSEGLRQRGRGLITLTDVRRIHELAMTPVWEIAPHPDASPDERPGSFRTHDIARFPGGMKPPSWTEVHPAMTAWVEQASRVRREGRPPLEALADLHASFERIHPFLDGNGRAGRLALNLLLLRLGYAPAIIRVGERARYLDHLRTADRGDPGPLGEFLARATLDVILRFVVPLVAAPRDLVPIASLADDDLSLRALRAAAERGRLRAQRDERGRWRSTKAWVDEYRAGRYRRRESG